MKTNKQVFAINLLVLLRSLVLYLRPDLECGCGEIGRHARFRFWCRKVCGFESLHPHNSNFNRKILQKNAMQINQEPIDALSAQVTVTLDKNDYEDRCDNILKSQRKQVTLPGFRKGKVPMSIVKKQYGRTVLTEEIKKIKSYCKHN